MKPILDLCNLNKYIMYMRFRMVTLETILSTLNHNDWFATLDLQGAYFHVTILLSHRRFLRFVVTVRHHQYTMLPFSLSSARWVFSEHKCLVVVTAYLRKRGVPVLYLDDWLLRGRSRAEVLTHVHFILHLLSR